ncbi:glycosyltransferase [Alicyclobacillus pomorum]|uniref:glycosyltransferase n=1 Tax=Alicyclobacillus pomorum TaxID=204470 RepID=UPI000684381A|nr:glycosyltransferase [Alicyclobacillus pomorum]
MNYQVLVFAAGNERGGAASHIATLAAVVRERGLQPYFCFGFVGDGPLVDRTKSQGVTTVVFPSSPWAAVSALRKYIKQRTQPVILHAHGPRLNVLAYLASRSGRNQWVTTVHSNPYKDFLSSRWKTLILTRLNHWCVAHSDGVFVVHPMFGEFFPTSRVLYVPNGISLKPLERDKSAYRLALRRQLNLPEGTPLLGIAARFDPVKDIGTIIRAVPKMRTANAHLVVAGDGEQRQPLEQLVDELGVRDRVHFLGFIDNVLEFYAALDIHVLASHSEGTPFSVLEAGWLGVPNIGTSIPGLTRLLLDGETGRCFPVGDATALAEVADDLFEHPDIAQRLARAFAERIIPEYTPEKMLQAYLDGYEQVLGAQRHLAKEREMI